MAKKTSAAILVGLGVALLLLGAGCYTQLAMVRVESGTNYEDEYEERYVEADTTTAGTADSTVYHRVDVYHHGLYRGPYFVYDPWWYWWDPYYAYPWRFSFAWRVHYYWDPWHPWYPYWGDPWYWTPFSYYGGWAYYGPSWGWSYYYHPRYRYWEQPYARRPFGRRPFLAGHGSGESSAPPMTAVSGTRTRSAHEGAGQGLARPAADSRRPIARRSEESGERRVARDEARDQTREEPRRISREVRTPAPEAKRDADVARRVPKSPPPASAPAKSTQSSPPPKRARQGSGSSSPVRSAPAPSYSPQPSYSPPPASHSGSSSGGSSGSRQSSGSSRSRTRG